MAIGKFDEIDNKKSFSDTKAPKESKDKKDLKESKEKTRYPKNQILQTPESYRKSFKQKMEQNAEKKNTDAGKEKRSKDIKKDPEADKRDILKRKSFKEMLIKAPEKTIYNKEQKNNSTPEKTAAQKFRESLKYNGSKAETDKYNAEKGYPNTVSKRKPGGWERQRTRGDGIER